MAMRGMDGDAASSGSCTNATPPHSAIAPQASGPVAIAATQHDPHDAPPMGFGGGNEQGIGGGTSMVDFRPLIQSDGSESQEHMMVGGCHVDVPGLD
jgi:hypothetical protein